MAAYSDYALRVPSTLMDDIRIASVRDGVSVDSFIVQAVAEKMATLRAGGTPLELTEAEQAIYLKTRAARSSNEQFAEVLAAAGTTRDILPGDELPDGWLDGQVPVDGR